MRGKFGLAVLIMAAAAWFVAESQSYAGHHRRRGHCGGCYSACTTGCTTGCAPASSGCCTATPADETAPAPPAPEAPAAPSPSDASAAPASEAPQVAQAAPASRVYNTASRRTRRWFRR